MPVPELITARFPGAIDEARFVAEASVALHQVGFDASNTLVAVSVCRDELSRSLVGRLEGLWGPVFDLSGLAGLPSGGVSSVAAALSHRPMADGRSNFVVFALSHVGVDDDGVVGRVRRPGMAQPTATCGSLSGVAAALDEDRVRNELDLLDQEQVRVEQRLAAEIGDQPVHDLADLAGWALTCIEDDIDQIFEQLTGRSGRARSGQPLGVDGAVFTGIQVHHYPERTAIWPASRRIEVGGEVVVDG